jgi:hypothetical protein
MNYASKRTKFQVIPNNSTTTASPLCKHCARCTNMTLGNLVRCAYTKNKAMADKSLRTPLNQVVRQRALWDHLRQAFFAPGIDSDALSDTPALIQDERLAYPCRCRKVRLPKAPSTLTSSSCAMRSGARSPEPLSSVQRPGRSPSTPAKAHHAHLHRNSTSS